MRKLRICPICGRVVVVEYCAVCKREIIPLVTPQEVKDERTGNSN